MTVQVFVDVPDGRTVLAGELTERLSATGTFFGSTFQYAPSYLTERGRYELCPELPLGAGPIAATGERPLAGVFADAQPDRWGRNLLFAAERHAAVAEGRQLRQLTDFDFLLRVRDDTRLGAVRLSTDGGTTFVASPESRVPTLVGLGDLVDAAHNLAERAESDDELALLVAAGTSMGGARPKATVRDDGGRLALAKLPSTEDRWNVLGWEATSLELARRSGIATPPFELHPIDPDRAVLVIERFDREADDRRVGYLSAHSLVEQGPYDVTSYDQLAESVVDVSADPRRDARELFRRVALTLLVNNVDDHMKNHGMLWTGHGWTLSPVFDVNPFHGRVVDSTPLVVGGSRTDRTIDVLLASADAYGLGDVEAASIVLDVERVTSDWAQVAALFGIGAEEAAFMAPAFEHANREAARALAARYDLVDPARADGSRPAWVRPHLRNGKPVVGHFRVPPT